MCTVATADMEIIVVTIETVDTVVTTSTILAVSITIDVVGSQIWWRSLYLIIWNESVGIRV